MNNTIRNIVVVSSLTVLASLASAQVLRGAAGTARMPVIPPPPPPPAAAANIAAQGAAASTAAVRAPMITPASANAASAAQAHAAADVPAGTPNVEAQMHASAQGQAAGAAFTGTTANQASVSLDVAGTVREIREAAFAARDSVTAKVQARLDASAAVIADLRARAEASGEKSRAAFAKALVGLRQHEKELRASLKASTEAAGESSWGEVQSALAQDYGAYAQAMIQAESAAQGGATTEPKS